MVDPAFSEGEDVKQLEESPSRPRDIVLCRGRRGVGADGVTTSCGEHRVETIIWRWTRSLTDREMDEKSI